MKQGINTVKNYRGFFRTAKYYFSQTYTMFYEPLIEDFEKQIRNNMVWELPINCCSQGVFMNIEELFCFLKKDYNLSYKYQEFNNCYGGNWTVQTHSFYNESGCFTIYCEIQRGLGFWYASRFSTERTELCEREIDVSSIEPQIWDKNERIWIFKNPFFWWNANKVLSTLAQVLKAHLAKYNDFFGIQV